MLINVVYLSLIEFVLFLSEALIFALPIFGCTKGICPNYFTKKS